MSKRKRLALRAGDFFRLSAPSLRLPPRGAWRFLRRFFQEAKNYRSDTLIREEVSEQLANHPAIDGSQIEVQVKNGVVLLAGKVHDRWTKRAAEWAVEKVPGVRDVQNQLQVQGWPERRHRSA